MIWFSRKCLFTSQCRVEMAVIDTGDAIETRKHKSLFNVRMELSGWTGIAQSSQLK